MHVPKNICYNASLFIGIHRVLRDKEIHIALGDVLGIGIVVIAYGLSWILLLRSLKIVSIIDREKLKHVRQIKIRLKAGNTIPKTEQ